MCVASCGTFELPAGRARSFSRRWEVATGARCNTAMPHGESLAEAPLQPIYRDSSTDASGGGGPGGYPQVPASIAPAKTGRAHSRPGGWLVNTLELVGPQANIGDKVGLDMHRSTADTWHSEFHVAIHLEHSFRLTSIPPTAGTPFEPATIRAASSETGTCHSSSPAFFQTGQIEYPEVDLP